MSRLLLFFLAVLLPIKNQAQGLYFPPNNSAVWDTMPPSALGWCQTRIDSLYALLDSNDTKAFVLLKDGKIVLEKYFAGQSPSSMWRWASAGKTVTATLVGIAQQENLLSITDTTSTYLGPGWSSLTTAQEERINIRHQLTMTSGLNDGVADL
jgi:CubicO group peptidase (beta-lactamase class C family)